MNEQNKSIAVGPFYIGTYFETYRVSDLETSVPRMCKTPNWICTYNNGAVCIVKNRNLIALIFWKIYQFTFYVIK